MTDKQGIISVRENSFNFLRMRVCDMLSKKHIFLQDKEKKKPIAVKAVVRDT